MVPVMEVPLPDGCDHDEVDVAGALRALAVGRGLRRQWVDVRRRLLHLLPRREGVDVPRPVGKRSTNICVNRSVGSAARSQQRTSPVVLIQPAAAANRGGRRVGRMTAASRAVSPEGSHRRGAASRASRDPAPHDSRRTPRYAGPTGAEDAPRPPRPLGRQSNGRDRRPGTVRRRPGPLQTWASK